MEEPFTAKHLALEWDELSWAQRGFFILPIFGDIWGLIRGHGLEGEGGEEYFASY